LWKHAMSLKIVLGWKGSLGLLETDWCGTSKIWGEEEKQKKEEKEKLRRGVSKEEERKVAEEDKKVGEKLKVLLTFLINSSKLIIMSKITYT